MRHRVAFFVNVEFHTPGLVTGNLISNSIALYVKVEFSVSRVLP